MMPNVTTTTSTRPSTYQALKGTGLVSARTWPSARCSLPSSADSCQSFHREAHHTCLYTLTHTLTPSHVHMHTLTHLCTYTCMTHTFTHAHAYAFTYTLDNTVTHTHSHTHTQGCDLRELLFLSHQKLEGRGELVLHDEEVAQHRWGQNHSQEAVPDTCRCSR